MKKKALQEEKRIKEGEQFYKALFESAGDAIFIMQGDCFIDCNTKTLEMFGCAREEIIGKPPYRFSPPKQPDGRDSKEKALEKINAAFGGVPQSFEWQHIKFDGTPFDAEVSLTIFVHEEKKFILAVVRDVSERKESEEAILHERKFSELLINSSVDGIIAFDRECRYTLWNKGIEQMSGLQGEYVIGKFAFDLFPFLIETGEDKYYYETLEGKTVFSKDRPYDVPETGEKGFHESHYSPIVAESGEIVGGLIIVQVVTERKLVEEALEESEKTARALINATTDAAVLIDKEGIIIRLNDTMAEWLGQTSHNLIGTNIFDYLPSELAEQRKMKGLEAAKAHAPVRFEDKRGDRWLENSVFPVYNPQGKVTRYAVYSRDITERKQKEVKLIEAKKTAEAANRLKSEFLAMMSHEIRTPMNTVLGMLDLLSETSMTQEQLHFTNASMAAGDTLLHLIDDIIDLSKIESDQVGMEEVNFCLDEILSERLIIYKNKVKEKNLKFVSNISEYIPDTLMGDPARLCQIINNLLDNAIKFTEKGEVSIEVKLLEKIDDADNVSSLPSTITGSPQAAEKATLLFSVKDTGIGIPKEKQNMIFDLFSQADTSTSRKFGGTGIGLSISKKLVEKMGGDIRVESEVGKGSTFYVTIPLGMKQKDNPPSLPPETLKKVATNPIERALKILLVEDSEDNQMLIKHYLKKTPYQVNVAENGKIAFQMVKSGNYDLVLMDLEMPVMDGYAATREIRKFEVENRKDPTPIVALTAHALKEDKEKSLGAGCTAHVTKPIKKDKLLEVIYEYVSK